MQAADDPLVISGGGLTIAGASTISGEADHDRRVARIKPILRHPHGHWDDIGFGREPLRQGKGKLESSQLTSLSGNANATTLEATGTGSAPLTLANLASVTEGSNTYPSITQFEAFLAGGTVMTLSAANPFNTEPSS